MDSIYDGKINPDSQQHYADFNWEDFVEKLFQQPPRDPFTYTMEFLEKIDAKTLTQLLGNLLVKGVKQKYNKEIANLEPQEINEIQKYFHSIGYEVKYQIERKQQLIPELHIVVPVNYFNIDFVPYSQLYNTHNVPFTL